jgi:hypothetical protein
MGFLYGRMESVVLISGQEREPAVIDMDIFAVIFNSGI